MESETGTIENDERDGMPEKETYINRREDLRKICGTIAIFERKTKPKKNFAFVNGNVVIKPQVELIRTPWLMGTEYLVNSEILFGISIYSKGEWQPKRVRTMKQMLELLTTQKLWDKFIWQVMLYLGKTATPHFKINKF